MTTIEEISVHEARAMATQGAILIDVREPAEWAEGHVAESVLMPLAHLDPGKVPSDRAAVVICRSGNRSGVAAQLLSSAGHPRVLNVTGGIQAWQAAGLPTVTGFSRNDLAI